MIRDGVVLEPKLLIADEADHGADVTTQSI